MKNILIVTIAVIVNLIIHSQSHSGWFTPKNYEDCVLENMKGVESDKAALLIAKSCRLKFPESEISFTHEELYDQTKNKSNYFDQFDEPPKNDQSKSITYLRKASHNEKIQFWSELSGELNKNFPMPVDDQTMIVNSSPVGNGIRWNYQMTNLKLTDKSTNYWNGFLRHIRSDSISRFCTSTDSRFFRDSNAQIELYYYGKAGKFIGKILFMAGDKCNM